MSLLQIKEKPDINHEREAAFDKKIMLHVGLILKS